MPALLPLEHHVAVVVAGFHRFEGFGQGKLARAGLDVAPAVVHGLGMGPVVDGVFNVEVVDAVAERLQRVGRCFAADPGGVAHVPQCAEGVVVDAVEQQLAVGRRYPLIMGLENPLETVGTVELEYLVHHLLPDVGHVGLGLALGKAAAIGDDRPVPAEIG